MAPISVQSILVYPIKSIGALRLEEAELDARGFTLDRRWLVVDGQGRQPPGNLRRQMFRVMPELRDGAIVLTVPEMEDLVLPVAGYDLSPNHKIETQFGCTATVLPEIYSRWFSKFLGTACHLVQMLPEDRRPVREDAGTLGDLVNFSDLSAVHLLNEASLRDLNGRLRCPLTASVFRPNLVVHAEPAHIEDTWPGLRIGSVLLDTGIPCPRCSMTLSDPLTGVVDPDGEPLKTLSLYRKDSRNHLNFGQYFAVRQPGWVRVGDLIEPQ